MLPAHSFLDPYYAKRVKQQNQTTTAITLNRNQIITAMQFSLCGYQNSRCEFGSKAGRQGFKTEPILVQNKSN